MHSKSMNCKITKNGLQKRRCYDKNFPLFINVELYHCSVHSINISMIEWMKSKGDFTNYIALLDREPSILHFTDRIVCTEHFYQFVVKSYLELFNIDQIIRLIQYNWLNKMEYHLAKVVI